MVALVLLAVLVVAVFAATIVWATYLVHVGILDARDLAEKVGAPSPTSALDWPELRIAPVLPPDNEGVMLVTTGWPAHPGERRLLVLRPAKPEEAKRLTRWCSARASVSVHATSDSVEFRRRRTLKRVHALLLEEEPVHDSEAER